MSESSRPRDVMWAPPQPKARRHWSTWAWALILVAYLGVLAVVTLIGAILPDLASPALRALGRQLPWLTFPRMEFAANVALFVPFGFILSFLFRRASYLVFPAAFVTTVAIESLQSLALFNRIPSSVDVIANAAGACVGILVAAPFVHFTRAVPPDREKDSPRR